MARGKKKKKEGMGYTIKNQDRGYNSKKLNCELELKNSSSTSI